MANSNETLMTMVCDIFSGPMKALSYMAALLAFFFTGTFIYGLVKFMAAVSVTDHMHWGLVVILSALLVAMLKIWIWIQMAKNSIIRALKK